MPRYSCVFPYDVMVSLPISASVFMEASSLSQAEEKRVEEEFIYTWCICVKVNVNFLVTDYPNQGFIEVPREENSGKLAVSAHDTAGTRDSRMFPVPQLWGENNQQNSIWYYMVMWILLVLHFCLYLICKFVLVLELNGSWMDKKLISSFIFLHIFKEYYV